MSAYLFIKRDDDLERIPLTENEFYIGRLPENDITLSDGKVSRQHCKILRSENEYVLKDLNSSNGSVVNKRRINRCELKEGDQIILGETILFFSHREEGPEDLNPDMPEEPSKDSSIIKNVEDIPEDYRKGIEESISEGSIWSRHEKKTTHRKQKEETKSGIDKFILLYQLGKAITSEMDLEEVLQIVVKSIRDVYAPRRCVILVTSPDTETLIPKIAWDSQDGYVDEQDVEISWTIANRALEEKVSVFSSDAPSDPRFEMGRSILDFNIRSAMCVPLWEQEDVFGVIYVDDIGEKAFDDDDLDLLTAIGNQVAIRIKQEQLFEELKQEAVIRKNFERFHSPAVAEKILEQSREGKELQQDLQEGEISILFVDIQEFTNLAESLKPLDVAKVLNRFYDSMSETIFDHRGGVNKYMGDNVMGIFGAPIEDENHALRAVRAGQEMIQKIRNINQDLPDGIEINVRIGINSGTVVHGYVGSREVKEFTVIGDPVNVAARLEEMADPNNVFIGEQTATLLNGSIKPESLGTVSVRGKEDDMDVYRIPIPSD